MKFLLVLLAVFCPLLLCEIFVGDFGFFPALILLFLILCVDVIYVLFLFTRRLRRPSRIGIASLAMAILFTPGIAVGHGAMIIPAWGHLLNLKDPAWFQGGVVPIVVVFLIIFSIQFVFSLLFSRRTRPVSEG